MSNVIYPDVFRARLSCEFPLYKRIIWKILGKRIEGVDSGYRVTMYYFKDIAWIYKFEVDNE